MEKNHKEEFENFEVT